MVSGKMDVPKVYEDESFVCIRDIRPQARIHLLVFPKKHIVSIADAFPEKLAEGEKSEHTLLFGKLFFVASQIAREQGLMPDGFRSVINTGSDAGQTVFHLHLHLLGGEPLTGGFA
jgi:histidine triad (HIT) family protein